jgi:ABC-type nitrate/sulfonate/bicarbonate transport system permease component
VNPWFRKALAIACALLAWQGIALSGWVPADHFPAVTQILAAGRDMVRSGELPSAEGQTLLRALTGLLLTVGAGVVLALLAARHAVLARMWAPVVEIMRSIPPAALVPLAIFVLGLTPKLFIGIVVYAGFSTVYLTTLHALLNVEPVQIHAARTMGYSRLETLLRVRLPAATPAMFTGIRVAAGSALIASVASEMLAGKDGLGFLLFDTAFSLRTPEMFAVMFVAALNGILFNQFVVWARRPFARWQDRLHALGGTR